MQEYERIRSYLGEINNRLSQLGNESLPIADPLPTSDLGDTVIGRIQHLRSQGKI
jgi:hypothetical protein